MTGFNQIERSRRTAIYIRISTSQQQTDRQETELKEFALRNGLNFNEKTDMYIDIISGFKEGEARPQYSILKNKVEAGLYQQILFSEFSRLDRKPSNLLKSIEYYQSKNVWLWFGKQQMWVRDKSDISTQIMISVLAVMSQYEIDVLIRPADTPHHREDNQPRAQDLHLRRIQRHRRHPRLDGRIQAV